MADDIPANIEGGDHAGAMGDQAPFDDSTDKSEDEEEEDEEEETETTKYEVETVMQILLRNFSRTRIQAIKLKFDPANKETANYALPTADLNQRVATQTDHTLMRFQKLRPYDGWGNFNFEFLVDYEDMNGETIKYSLNWPELRQIRTEMQQQVLQA